MQIVIIAAISDNNVIGNGKDLVWSLPADERFFRDQIRDCFLLTGRVSFESPQGADIFAGRRDVVLVTRQRDYQAPYVQVAHSIPEAVTIAARAKAERLCILGGEEIYRQTMHLADQLIITEVHSEFEGAATFPVIDPAEWSEVRREDYGRDENNSFDYSFVFYERAKK